MSSEVSKISLLIETEKKNIVKAGTFESTIQHPTSHINVECWTCLCSILSNVGWTVWSCLKYYIQQPTFEKLLCKQVQNPTSNIKC